MKQFDRLYKTIFESVKPRPSKNNLNKILKEDVNDANTPESITPEQRAIIEKVVAKLASENQDYANTIEFAELDTDFFVMLLDDCYEDWLEDQGYDEEQPDMFDEVPGFEQFAYGSIKDYLQDYDADDEGTADMIVSNLYDLKKELFYNEFVEVLKPQLDTFKAAVQKLIDQQGKWGRDSYFVDFALRDTKWWDENGLKYSPELGQKIDKLQRMQEYLYDSGHIFAGDDYNDWDYPDALLKGLGLSAWFYDEDETPELPLESKKVDKSKKVIKEHRAHRPSRRRVIKEDRLTQDQWLDMLQEKFDGIVKDLCERYPNELINSINTEYFSSDPEDNACQVLDGLFVDLIDRFPQELLSDREKKWIGKYSDQWEGCEGLWSDYCWGGNDVGAYKDLRAKFPILADFVDKWVAEHPNEGSNAKYHYTDPRAKNPPYPVAESVKKPVSKRRVIKESAPVKKQVKRIRKQKNEQVQ